MERTKIKRIIGRIAAICAIAALFGITVYNVNATMVLGDKMPMPLGVGASVVLSGSMEPELSVDDVVIVKKTDEFYVGQIIVFQTDNSLTVHKIERFEGDKLVTKGTANNAEDEPIERSAVKGEVIYVIPGVGTVVKVLQSPVVTILLIIGAVVLMERSYGKEKNESQTELDDIMQEIKKLKDEELAELEPEQAPDDIEAIKAEIEILKSEAQTENKQ